MKCLAAALLWGAVTCSHTWALEIPYSQQFATVLSHSQLWTTRPLHPQLTPDEFTEEVTRLVERHRISEERLGAVPQVLGDLERVINTLWPGSRVIVYGSLVHGLAMAASDIDCSIFRPYRVDSSLNTSKTLIDQVSDTLWQYPHLFSNLHSITFAEIPVITFKHEPTQFSVDLTINNFNAVQVSSLLNCFIRADDRIYYLAFIVKYWAKVHRVTKCDELPNYGLLLMVVFYLQQRDMLPSVASLQVDPIYMDVWNVGFCYNKYEVLNNVSLNMLLGGFFEYYVDFDYEKYIVSPYAGYPIDKKLFADINKVPSEFSLYVKNVKANVTEPLSLDGVFFLQDMFVHDHNVVKFLNNTATFLAHFQHIAMQFRENNSNFVQKILVAPSRTNELSRK